MGFFTKKQEEKENLTYEKRLQALDKRLTLAENDIVNHGMALDGFRDKVLRKIQTRKDKETEEKPKDLYNGMLIPE